jgi:hypothetical protein
VKSQGLPIILLCHCPLYTPETFDAELKHIRKNSVDSRKKVFHVSGRRAAGKDTGRSARVARRADLPSSIT